MIGQIKINKMKKKKPFIIGEVASAHEGNYKQAIKICRSAFAAGADAVKFQIFKSRLLVSTRNPLFQKFQKLEISQYNWKKVIKKFKKNFLIAEVFDFNSLKFADSLKAFKIYKLPSTCLMEKDMLLHLKKLNQPVILAAGGAKLNEIKYALKYLKFNREKIVIMSGFQNFPTKIENSNLGQIRLLKEKFKTNIGYADHTDSNDIFFSHTIPLMAYSLGANIIEKHITLNRKKRGTDYHSSLNPDEFKVFVDRIKVSTKILSDNNWRLTKPEINYRKFNKKFAVYKQNVSKGAKIKLSDIEFKRTNQMGITKDLIKKKISRKTLKKNKLFDQILLEKDFY